jgi:translation initiation factor 2A
MDFWDVNKKKKMGSNTAHCAVGYGWSPDSRKFMVSTTAPRMNVDNGVKFFKYNGAGPIGSIDKEVLYEASWRPAAHGAYPDRPQSPLRKGEAPPAIAAQPKVARYRPPGAGSKGAGFAER